MATGSIYRKAIWFKKGLSEYTKNGFAKASRRFISSDMTENISNHAYMITGANSGLGKSTAQSLASRGATVYMVCRNKERGEATKQQIIDISGNERVELFILDLSQPEAVIKFAEEFVASEKPIDVLVNNAGVMNETRILTDDDLESNFCVNTLGTYLLTTRLFPALQRSSLSQVITVSSGGMLLMKLDPHDLQFENVNHFDGTFAYAQNKRQQVVMSRKWAEANPAIHFSVMHPGWADTPAVQNSMPNFYLRMEGKLRSPEEGADTIVWLCSASSATKYRSGSFFQDRQVVAEHLPLAWSKSTPQDEELLMTRLEELAVRFSPTHHQTSTEEDSQPHSPADETN